LKKTLSTFAVLLFCSVLFAQSGCPVFQLGNPGQPNSYVTFYTQNGTPVATCHCQLTGNKLKCGDCVPASGSWYYYTVTYNGQPVNCYNSVVLGVEWAHIEGAFDGSNVQLNWGTFNETNNFRFHIERSPDGRQLNPIGWIEGSGNSIKPKAYTYYDNSPSREEPYYRIVQEDFDGKISTSSWIMVNGDDVMSTLPISPNPTNGSFTVYIRKYWGE
jgi:hypothetical protein